jgi:hexosaminidase
MRNILLCLIIPILSFRGSAQTPASISIVPQPVSIKAGDGFFQLKKSVSIRATQPDEKHVALLLADFLKTKGVNVSQTISAQADVIITLIKQQELGSEGYLLAINKKNISLNANTGVGLFHGLQTLMQAITENKIPALEITDYPRFEYRGIHLDVGRHMFPVDFIKKYIDLMAKHKMNRFHWHLTEDQGWRIEIKKYPKLTEVGAYRNETVIGRSTTRTRAQAKYDGERYGGFYTQDEIKDVVKYAADRYITIVPEIELPGHAQAALTSYPNLGCTGGPYEVARSWGVFKDVYCAGKEETFTFLQDVLDEVIQLFPGKYIHIGGDECPKDWWKECPHCQKRIAEKKLKDEHELQSYFVQRIEKYLNSKGKQIIGWDEILEGGLAANATVMSWRGESGGIAAAKQNHDVIMSPENWCYLDHAQDTSKTEPLSIGNYTPVSEVYFYEPVPPQLSAAEAKHVIGAQANLWTEYIKTPTHAEYMLYPRACAMAEVLWSPKESRDYNDFLTRMKVHLKRLDSWKVNYAKHIEKELVAK